ncbi:MAG: hypothetical protein LC670_12800, partial [Flavobacteriales bacterium]|nr:hypothetical protein [Flavobacteriales bacterium]
EAVKWDSETQVNVNATENRLEKIQGGTNWNAGASSHNSVHDNGSFSFTTEENNRQKAAGLSHSNTNSNLNSIEFAFRMNANGSLRIYESGSNRGTFGNYVAGDNLKISVENGTVHYYRNGELLRVSNNSPELPLIADASLRSEGATISEAEITNLNEGNFIANAVNVGSNPTYQWMVNGVNAGENGPNFSNSELNGGDVITCELTPDLTGCGAATFLSNEIEKVQVEAPAAINFYITGEAAGSACNLAAEAVQWDQSSLISTAAAGNQLEKIQGGNNWNAGGASLNRVHDNGSFRFTTDENNRQKAAGLSHEDANSHINSIEFAFRMEANGSLRIYESGSNRGTFGSYEEGDNFEIAVENGTVHYYHNGELLRVSNTAPELPLLADVSMRSHGATIGKAFITNLNDGVFSANAENVGDNPVYQWKVNGTNAGENSAVFSDPGISSGDIITCELTPDLGGCGEVVYHSNDIEKIQITAPAPLNFYLRGEVSEAACYSAIEEVQWSSSSLVNMAASGNSIQKIQGGTNWNANASSLNKVFDNGRLRFAPNETNRQKAMGLSHEDANDHINSIQFAFRMESNGSLRIYESGNNRGTFGSFNAGDTLEIAVDNGTVKYFHNSELLYISGNTPNLPLLADASIRQEGGSIGKVHITNLNDGTFSANAENAGDNPVFQWFLNSAPVGDNLPTYTNPAPENGDVVFCALSPDLGGCSDIVYNSNAAKSIIQDVTDQSAFFAEGTVDLGGFGYAAEDLVWNPGSLQNTVAEGNSLLKVQSNNNWNGAAVSFNTVKDEGYFEFIATETNRRRAVGLSNSNTGVHLNNIQFAFYLDSNGSLRIYESGSNRGTFGSYSAGDVFRIAAEAGEVKYYRNGTLIRTSAITPILPLLAHVSIYSSGGTVTNAVIANKTGGAFTA